MISLCLKNNLRENEDTPYINDWFLHSGAKLSELAGTIGVAPLIYLLRFRLKDSRRNTRKL